MKSLLKSVHFEMFNLSKRQAFHMEFHSDAKDEKIREHETIRNDQTISELQKFYKVLEAIENEILVRL